MRQRTYNFLGQFQIGSGNRPRSFFGRGVAQVLLTWLIMLTFVMAPFVFKMTEEQVKV